MYFYPSTLDQHITKHSICGVGMLYFPHLCIMHLFHVHMHLQGL
jgi:hypothetical protein